MSGEKDTISSSFRSWLTSNKQIGIVLLRNYVTELFRFVCWNTIVCDDLRK